MNSSPLPKGAKSSNPVNIPPATNNNLQPTINLLDDDDNKPRENRKRKRSQLEDDDEEDDESDDEDVDPEADYEDDDEIMSADETDNDDDEKDGECDETDDNEDEEEEEDESLQPVIFLTSNPSTKQNFSTRSDLSSSNILPEGSRRSRRLAQNNQYMDLPEVRNFIQKGYLEDVPPSERKAALGLRSNGDVMDDEEDDEDMADIKVPNPNDDYSEEDEETEGEEEERKSAFEFHLGGSDDGSNEP